MSILGNILSGIFGGRARAQPAPQQSAPQQQPAPQAPRPQAAPTTGAPAQSATQPNLTAGIPGVGAVAAAPEPVNVEAVLTHKASQKDQALNWKTSIVDLMKVLDIDSSLDNRKELARELGYTGSTDDSATMNVWLHKEVMKKVGENGGTVPANLKD